MVAIHVVEGDLLLRPCDVLLLKHADGYYGFDSKIARLLKFSASISDGDYAFVRGVGLAASKVLFVGVGVLSEFRYERIRHFARDSLILTSKNKGSCKVICTPIHGPGYGLDDIEAFLSLISGFRDAIDAGQHPPGLERIEIVEINPARARRLTAALTKSVGYREGAARHNERTPQLIGRDDFGASSEEKKKVFVAMPFAEAFSDVWDIAIQDACAAESVIAERIDAAIFTGDIFSEIKVRLERCGLLIALLDGGNPNVFLELRYALGLKKPTILVASSVESLPFDVKGQRCLIFKNLHHLRKLLAAELQEFKIQKVL